MKVKESMQTRHLKVRITAIVMLALIACWAAREFRSANVAAQTKQQLEQDIERTFSAHEDLQLSPDATVQRIRNSGHLSLQTAAHDFEIDLRPNDLRAANYVAQAIGDDGMPRALPRGEVVTYKGSVSGMSGSDARVSVNGGDLEGMILTSSDTYFLEAASKYSAAANSSDYMIYKATDLRPDAARYCGVTLEDEVNSRSRNFEANAATGATPQ